MNTIRIKVVSGFKGEDVVLLAVDAPGRDAFVTALTAALGTGSSRLARPGRPHDVVLETGASDVAIGVDRVLWRLDPDKVREIVEKAEALGGNERNSGHHYVDMRSPTVTLVLSLNEYLAPSWLTAGKQPLFGDDDPD